MPFVIFSFDRLLAPPGIHDRLVWDTDHYVLTRKNQTLYSFNPDGTLAQITDRNQNSLLFTYTNQQLSTVTDPSGRQLIFTYTSDRLAQVTDPLGRNAYYGCTNGLLTSSTDLNGEVTTYGYDESNRLSTITDANNHTSVNNAYNTLGQVTQQLDANNNITDRFSNDKSSSYFHSGKDNTAFSHPTNPGQGVS